MITILKRHIVHQKRQSQRHEGMNPGFRGGTIASGWDNGVGYM